MGIGAAGALGVFLTNCGDDGMSREMLLRVKVPPPPLPPLLPQQGEQPLQPNTQQQQQQQQQQPHYLIDGILTYLDSRMNNNNNNDNGNHKKEHNKNNNSIFNPITTSMLRLLAELIH